jgi:hypothetical protein
LTVAVLLHPELITKSAPYTVDIEAVDATAFFD